MTAGTRDNAQGHGLVVVDIAVAVVIAWWAWLVHVATWPLIGTTGFDALRDLAIVQNQMHGHFLSDANYAGSRFWYPPLWPAFHSLIGLILGKAPALFHCQMMSFINPLIPIAFYVGWRKLLGSVGGAVATLAFLFLIEWTRRHAGTVMMPSVLAFGLFSLGIVLLRPEALRRSPWAAYGRGALLGGFFWFHVGAAAILAASLGLAGAVDVWRDLRRGNARPYGRAIIGMGVVLIPYLLLCDLPWPGSPNTSPAGYLSPLLQNLDFAAYGTHWIIPCLVAAGFLVAIFSKQRDWPMKAAIAISVVGLAGESLGHAHLAGGVFGMPSSKIPLMLPHEFQWWRCYAGAALMGIFARYLFQLASPYLDRLVPRVSRWGLSPSTCAVLAIMALVAWNGLQKLPEVLPKGAFGPDKRFEPGLHALEEISSIEDVVLTSTETAYYHVGPYTGRKIVASPAAHSNPRVDIDARLNAVKEALLTKDIAVLNAIVSRYGVRFAFITEEERKFGGLLATQGSSIFRQIFRDDNVEILELSPKKTQ